MSQQKSGLTSAKEIRSQETNPQITQLKNVLEDVGVKLSFTDDFNVVTQEHALVAQSLEKKLEAASATEVNDFICSIKTLCEKEKYFKRALMYTVLKRNTNEDSTIEVQQDSLIRLFLRVDVLQTETLEMILDAVTSKASEESQDTSWLRLLLHPLRYLPHIKNPELLTTKLLDILEIAIPTAQLDILDSLPEILPDNQCNVAAKQLAKLLDDNDELLAAIIDCLNALNLESELRLQLQDRILSNILAGTSTKTFPILLEYIMTDWKMPNLVQTFFKIRNALHRILMSGKTDEEKESSKILIFNRLQLYAIAPKTISEAWVNMILTIKVHSDHKAVDYLILFMLYYSAIPKKKMIESIFRKRVQSGLFKIALLEKVFTKYIPKQLFKDYSSAMVEIGCSLLRASTEVSVQEFAKNLFSILFQHEYAQAIFRQEILENLLVLTGVSNQKSVSNVLKIISNFLEDTTKLQRHAVLLMRLLEKLDTFELKNVKEVFEILCSLTCGERADDSLAGLKDEIHMLLRKQLSSSKRNVKQMGIVGAVVMAKHIVITTEEQSDVSGANVSTTFSQLPIGKAREAAGLLELIASCTAYCTELMGLYYDQLAAMLMTKEHLDKYFMAWLYESITDDFQNTFITETVCTPVNDLTFSMQYTLNSTEEINSPIGINIAELTVKPTENQDILLLAPQFRLLRLLHYKQQNGDLSTIDALLGCSVILPETDNIGDLSTDQIKQIADCLFHCANWFREVISGFVTQQNQKLRAKVVQRLNDLITVEKLLQSCLEYTPEYKLPVSYFGLLLHKRQHSSNLKDLKIINPKKKFKSAVSVSADETSILPSGSTPAPSKARPTVPKKAVSHEYNIDFREIDVDVVILLEYPLTFADDSSSQSPQTAMLNVNQVQFILNDYVNKLATLTQDKDVGLSHLNTVVPLNLIKDSTIILPYIDKHLKVIVDNLTAILESTDGRNDLPEIFSEHATEIKSCFGVILESLCLLFNWPGFQHSRNINLLKNILKSIRPEQSQSLMTANRLIHEYITRLSGFCDYCLLLPHAVSLIKTMEGLYSTTTPSPDIRKKIATASGKLLSKRWYNSKGDLETGKNCNSNIAILVTAYLNGASIKTIRGIVATLQDQAPKLERKEDCLHMLTAIDKQNFHVFYLGLCDALLNRINIEIQAITNNDHLVVWHTTALTLQGLMAIAKAQGNKTNLLCFLKKSIGILKLFLNQGIPILEIMLRSKPDDIVVIFKTIQTSTRFLHHLCCFSKVIKNTSLMAHVPKFRQILETLVYRVKAALVANNCSAAFWMGNLRNRDLQGEDILSQNTVDTNEEEEIEQDLEDDSDSDMINETTSVHNKSDSDVI